MTGPFSVLNIGRLYAFYVSWMVKHPLFLIAFVIDYKSYEWPGNTNHCMPEKLDLNMTSLTLNPLWVAGKWIRIILELFLLLKIKKKLSLPLVGN